MKSFQRWLEATYPFEEPGRGGEPATWRRAVDKLAEYLGRSTYMDDPISVIRIAHELNLNAKSFGNAILLINKELKDREQDAEYVFNPTNMTVYYSSSDI